MPTEVENAQLTQVPDGKGRLVFPPVLTRTRRAEGPEWSTFRRTSAHRTRIEEHKGPHVWKATDTHGKGRELRVERPLTSLRQMIKLFWEDTGTRSVRSCVVKGMFDNAARSSYTLDERIR